MEQLTGFDGFHLHMEMHGLPMHLCSFSIYNPSTADSGQVTFHEIKALYEETALSRATILRSKLLEVPMNWDQPYWIEDDEFDIEFHVRHIALPPPGNWQALCDLLSELHARPLDRHKPLWEAYVIEGLDHIDGIPGGCFGVLLKVHHAIMDGKTGMAMYASMHSLTPRGGSIYEEQGKEVGLLDNASEDVAKHKTPSVWQLMSRATINNTRRYMQFANLMARAVPLAGKVRENINSNGATLFAEKCRTRFNAPISPHRVIDRIKLPLVDIQHIRELADGATINDVALSLIGGAMQHYLEIKGERPELPLVATVPMDIRSKEEPLKGNMLSVMNVGLCSDIEDPVSRLIAIRDKSKAAKVLANLLGPSLVSEVMQTVYTGLWSWGLHKLVKTGVLDKLPPANNTVVTNVPGLPVTVYLQGAELIDCFGLGPLTPGSGLFHTISSNRDSLSISFTACREMLPDPNFYRQCLENSYCEFMSVVDAIAADPNHDSGALATKKIDNVSHRQHVDALSRPKRAKRSSDSTVLGSKSKKVASAG